MSTLRQTREALGGRLRELRRGARLSGQALADQVGWPQSKISKIETGRQTPSEDDVLKWTQATGHPEQAPDLLASLRTLETMYAEWRRQLHSGMRTRQQSISEIEADTALIRGLQTMFVPGLLQTAEYARTLMADSIRFHGGVDDLDEAVLARMARQEALYRPGRRFHFLITEAVLRYRFCTADVMAGQFDRLISATTLPTVLLGVIPFAAEYQFIPHHGFAMYDQRMVLVETIGAELSLTQPQEIALYEKVFGLMAAAAVYGRDARQLISAGLDGL